MRFPKKAEEAWKREWEKHSGDYGDSSEFDLESAFMAGWLSCQNTKKGKIDRYQRVKCHSCKRSQLHDTREKK